MSTTSPENPLERIDRKLVDLLEERFRLVRSGQTPLPCSPPDPGPAVTGGAAGSVPAPVLRAVFREILSAEAAIRRPARVAFLGPQATFTHQAALRRFGRSAEFAPQRTIADVFHAVSRGECAFGVAPVENSTEGAVTHTLDMFMDSNVSIVGEEVMPIHHNLLARGTLRDLRSLCSHPQVFAQCRRWLRDNLPNLPLVEVSSTTDAARKATTDPAVGALASILAAEEYDLPVLASNIEDMSGNTTRFLVLATGEGAQPHPDSNKISLLFVVRDRPGALYDCLEPLHRHGVNMSMIQSRPSRRRSWEYYFFVDLTATLEDPHVKGALDELSQRCEYVRILGNYPRAGGQSPSSPEPPA